MCLYEQKLLNTKYLTNKKNKGNIPNCNDTRQLYIKVGCGWCSECRRQLSNNWRIRLYEELKANKNCLFVTLSFSPENIQKLEEDMYNKNWRGLGENEIKQTDVNLLAAYAVRMWSERWRKFNKKAPKHWLITELGETNSERIHLHGLIWGDKKLLEKTWKYGNIYIGKWVDERTINYIVKYVTKIDKLHEGYKQKIFVSKGIGKNYIENNKSKHKYLNDKTNTTYLTRNGIKLGLPRYYKEKLWSEEEREKLWSLKLDENSIFLGKEKIKLDSNVNIFNRKLSSVRDNDKKANYGNNKTGNKKFIITDVMKKDYKNITKTNKNLVTKAIETRKVKIYEHNYDDMTISKSNNTDIIRYGEYIGTTTEAQRNYNELIKEADELGISVRVLRLQKAGIL